MNSTKISAKFSAVFRRLFLIGTLGLTFSQGASAATLDDVVRSIENLREYIASVVQTTTQRIFEMNPNMPATILGNQAQESAKIALANNTYNLGLAQVKQSLSGNVNNQAYALARLSASDTTVAKSNSISIFGSNEKEVNPIAGDANFDFETFLGTTAYTPNREAQAKNFLQVATTAYQTIPRLELDEQALNPKEFSQLLRTPAYRNYLLALRSYVASQSVGLDNLYYLLSERTVQPNLGKQAGIYNSQGQVVEAASPLQVKEYLAARRVTNQNWYDDMSKASPTTVSRESLFVLAEIRQELFTLQQQNERLLATMSLLSNQMINLTSKSQVERLQQEVKDQVNRIKGVPVSSTPTGVENTGIPGLPNNP